MRGLVQLIVVLVACLAGRSAGAAEDPPMLAGFAQRLSGETIVYHSPDPEVTAGLLVRSLDASRSVEWETAAVPADLDAEAVEFCWLFALQVDPARHRFTLSIDGAPAVAFTTAPSNSTRDWTVEGADGVSLRFRATMVDRFNDLMGYAILRVPRAKLRPGQPLRLSMHGETSGSRAWCITFQAAASAKASLRVLPALVRDAAGNYRPVEVSITHVGEPADAIITPSFGAPIRQRLEFGGNLLRLRHPEVDARREISVGIAPEGGAATTLLGSIEPVRHWSIDLVQHTHTDVGYTRPQTEILPEHLRFIDTALDYCDQTDGYPDDARFRWTCETSWAVREYLRTRSPAQIERLRRRAVEGRIEVTAMFLNMSEIVDEASFSAFLAPVAMARAAGIPVTTAVQNDVNGIAWCLADHFADLGIDYLVMGQHGHKALVPFDRPTPFWWESPAGRRVLAFRADHYHTGNFWGLHTGNIEAVEPELLRYLERLAASGYPFDRIAVENSGYPTDNAPPSTAACEVVRRWNERFVWPRLRSSVAREFPASLAKEHATELPVLRQAWTDWWTDGFGSAARETAAARRTQGRLVATEAVLAMEAIAGDQPPSALRNDVDAVRDALLFWGEHTLGAAESIREPLCENSVVQWAEKAAYAWDAVKREAALGEAVLGRLEAAPRGGRESRLLVVNPLGTRRSGTVELYADHELWPVDRVVRVLDETGKALAVQRLASRAEGSYWAIEVDDVPAFGWRTYRLERTDELAPPHAPSRGGQRLESPSYTLDFDARRGAIASLVDRRSGKELVDREATWGFGQILHERLDNREQLEGFRLDDCTRTSIAEVAVDGIDEGPIWSSLRFHGTLPGCGGVRGELRVFRHRPRVEVRYAIDKLRDTTPEGIYVAFPFAADFGPPAGRLVYETLGGVVDPNRDIIPGSASDWLAMQGFVAGQGPGGQVVLASNQIPLLQLGDLNLGQFARHASVRRPHVYSWVMNNYWTTNFCASQEGEFRFGYALTSEAAPSIAEATRFGREEMVPFLGRLLANCDGTAPLAAQSSLAFDAPGIVLVAARPASDGKGIILELRETEGRPARLPIEGWQFKRGQAVVDLVDPTEQGATAVEGAVDFAPFGRRFLRVRGLSW